MAAPQYIYPKSITGILVASAATGGLIEVAWSMGGRKVEEGTGDAQHPTMSVDVDIGLHVEVTLTDPVTPPTINGTPVPQQAQGAKITVEASSVTARLGAVTADPTTLEPVLAGLGRLARALTGTAVRGPYR